MGDTWYFRALSGLGQSEGRLVEAQDGTPLLPPPPRGDGRLFARLQLRLTENGEAALRGEADRVALLGIDRWLGGTHITPENLWRWDAVNARLVAPSCDVVA